MTDIRLEAANLLTAISDHDPFLSPSERSMVESVISILEAAMNREAAAQNIQTPLMDRVIPVREG
jgi:hypothetical protein